MTGARASGHGRRVGLAAPRAAAVVIALLAAVPGVVLAAPAPATAAGTPGLQVSADGVAWADDGLGPIFPEAMRLVPGDSLESTVWLRNASDQVARLGFSATAAWASSTDFADDLVLSAGLVGSGERSTASWTAAAGCASLVEGAILRPGDTVALRVGVDFSTAASGREGAGDRAGVDFVAVLRDPAVEPGPGADCSGGTLVPGLPGGPDSVAGTTSPGSIASTGADLMMAGFAAVLAGGLVATGILLLIAHSRARARSRPVGRIRP